MNFEKGKQKKKEREKGKQNIIIIWLFENRSRKIKRADRRPATETRREIVTS